MCERKSEPKTNQQLFDKYVKIATAIVKRLPAGDVPAVSEVSGYRSMCKPTVVRFCYFINRSMI